MRRALLFLALIGTAQAQTLAERGKYLAIAGDCTACHTAASGAPFAGGRPIETPFGRLLTPNITPDRETGIGAWTDAEFLRAMQHGIGRGGRHLYPAFPYPWFTRVNEDDLLAIRAWLQTLPPVRNQVHDNQLPFPYSIRASLIAWNALYFHPGSFVPNPSRTPEWNRGAYLVEGLGHCGACHTPKTALGGDERDRALQGGAILGWNAPALDGDPRTGLGSWSMDDIVTYLRTGHTDRAAAGGPMAEVVENSTSHMTAADLRAIGLYLKSQAAAPSRSAAIPPADPAMQAGAAIYADACAACHTATGAGIPRLFPRLAGSAAVQAPDPASALFVILRGTRSAATAEAPTGPAMPAFAWKLNDAQIAAVATYIRNAWGNAAPAVNADRVREARHVTE